MDGGDHTARRAEPEEGPATRPDQAGPAPIPLEATRASQPTSLRPGMLVLDGRFRVLELLGSGGMGEVYLAEQVSLGRKVALKALRSELSATPGMAERFRREALLLSTVEHPSVVRVIDYGETPQAYILVMEYVEGRTLAALVESGPLPRDRALRLLTQIAEGLEAIHAHGIVHRDLKLENVLVAEGLRGEQARLLDFGIARLAEGEGPTGAVTQAGLVIGTPEYLSPEQALGQSVDARSDVYSFGVLAFRLLSGKLPFQGPSPRQYLMQHASTPPPTLQSVEPAFAADTEVCELVARCLAKEPSARYPDGRALATTLHELQQHRTPSPAALPAHAVHAFLTRLRAVPELLWAGVSGLLIVAVLLVYALSGPSPARVARGHLEEGRPKEALLALEQAKDEDGQVAQLRAAALHRLDRHKDEWTAASGSVEAPGRVEPLTVAGLAEDYAKAVDAGQQQAPVAKALAKLGPRGVDALEELAEGPLGEAQWGALRYLDTARADADLPGLFAHALGTSDCEQLAFVGRRLAELGDDRAIAPLQRVLAVPRKRVLIFEKSCGHDEAEAALRKLRPQER